MATRSKARRPDESPIELTYWEGLRAYWRVYWPMQILGIVAIFAFSVLTLASGHTTSSLMTPLQIVSGAVSLFLFVPRICSRAYRGFFLVVVDGASCEAALQLSMSQRVRVWSFLWWRQILAGLFTSLLTMPLNMLLNIMGLQLSLWVATFAGLLGIGPILLKMLIGHQFETFRIEAHRNHTPRQSLTSAAP